VGQVAGAEPAVDRGTRSITAPTSGGTGAVARLAAELDRLGVVVEDLGLSQPTLDDVFLTLTGSKAEDQA
jgi:ABC-2 type transport system ATP-binding protein